MKITLKM